MRCRLLEERRYVVITPAATEAVQPSTRGAACTHSRGWVHDYTKDSIASQRYATPRDFAVNNVTLRVLNYDNEGSNYRDCTSVLGHDSKGSNDRGCTSGHIYPPLTLTHTIGLVDSVFKLVFYFN